MRMMVAAEYNASLPSGWLRRYSALMVRAIALALMALIVSVVFFRSAPARAEPPNGKATPVYVLSVWTNDVDDQADALTQALRSRVRQSPGWSLAETNQSFETLSLALRCPPTPNQSCLDRIGDQLHADHYVWGTMAREKAGEVSAELRLWSRGKPQVEATEMFSDNLKDPGDEALRAVAGRLFAKLTSSGTTGSLVVHAGTAAGAVLVDGVVKGKLDGGVARIDVPEGAHTISVRVAGFSAPSQAVNLQDGGEAEISFALSPAESAPGAEATPEASQEPAEKKPFPVRKVLGYSVVVVGVGFLVAAGIEGAGWLSDKSQSDQDRNSVPNNVADVCSPGVTLEPQALAKAADACQKTNSASNAVKLGWIFAGIGAVLAGTGIWLVVGDHGSDAAAEPTAKAAAPRPRFDVLPALGPRAGSLDVRMTF
jgi:hypothetical protein